MQALVVDDSSTMRKVLKSILTGAGFEVIEAKCGADALDRLKQNRADLALFDWNMPEMTGIELLGKVRSDHGYDAMKIMMVTTESETVRGRAGTARRRRRVRHEALHQGLDSRQAADYRIHPMKYRVLVVDDSVVMRRIVRQSLESDPEIEVVGVAANGKIALAMVEQYTLDAITLDIEMPEMDGLQTLRELRARGIRTPVIMFSTLTERGALATLDALAAGADDYVAKPANVGSVQDSMSRIRLEVIPKIKALCWKNKGYRSPLEPESAQQTSGRSIPRSPLRPQLQRPCAFAFASRGSESRHCRDRDIDRRTECARRSDPASSGRFSGSDCDRSAHAADLHPFSGRAPHGVFFAGCAERESRARCSSRDTPGSLPATST